jgi:hypothetical protein
MESGTRSSEIVKNTVHLFYWTAAWLVTQALAVFGPLHIWQSNNFLTGLVLFINLLMGIGMILANKRHLNGLDELQRKIQMDAMALSLGVGLVAGLGYSTLDVTNLIPFDAQISHLVILMGLTYLLGVLLGNRKYQ